MVRSKGKKKRKSSKSMAAQSELFRKSRCLNPFQLSLSAVVLSLLTFCLICALFFLVLGTGTVSRAFRSRATDTGRYGHSPATYNCSDSGGGGVGSSPSVEIGQLVCPRENHGDGEGKGEGESGGEQIGDCDYFDGKWVWDETYPLYDSRDCKFLSIGLRCSENGRPDNEYTKWRWQPNHCHLPRFDPNLMLEKLRNRRLAFVGDSIGRNQWESLLCMLASAVPDKSSIYEVNGNPLSNNRGSLVFVFRDYNCTVEYHHSPFLVMLLQHAPTGASEKVKMTVRVDQLDWSSSKWKDADVLIFNSGHRWEYNRTIRMGCYFQEGNEVKMSMGVHDAFQRSIETLVSWVDNQVNTSKTRVFFRSYSPAHYSASSGSCHLNTRFNSSLPVKLETWPEFGIVTRVLLRNSDGHASQTGKIHILNVTYMTAQREDGHSSVYHTSPPLIRQDCMHWCLPGVPDSWNELLYASMLN